MKFLIYQLWKDDSGQDLTEYALLLVLIALAAVVAIGGLSTAVKSIFSNAALNLTGTGGQ